MLASILIISFGFYGLCMKFYLISTSPTPQKFATLLERFAVTCISDLALYSGYQPLTQQCQCAVHKAVTVYWLLTLCRVGTSTEHAASIFVVALFRSR